MVSIVCLYAPSAARCVRYAASQSRGLIYWLERALVVANEVVHVHTHAEVKKQFTRPWKRVISTYTFIITQLTVRHDVGRSNLPTYMVIQLCMHACMQVAYSWTKANE